MKHLVEEAGVADSFRIESAATSSEELGNPLHYGTKQALDLHGIPYGSHRARRLKAADATAWDLIICMDEANVRNTRRMLGSDMTAKLYKMMDFAGTGGDVADPWYTGDFETTYADVMAGCTGLLRELEASSRQ